MPAEIVKFPSADGTLIAAHRTGRGPALVLVHGTTSDHSRWNIVLPRLETRFTCYAIDRRGRGESGDGRQYSLDAEVEDVLAVVEGIDGPVHLLGHSYGGLCAMEAALRTSNVAKLILYEPAVPAGGVYSAEILERLDWLLAIGDREQLVTAMLTEVAGIPMSTIELLRRQPYWKQRLATAHTIPRELREDEAYRIDAQKFAAMKPATLLLLGGASPAFYRQATRQLASAIPDARVEELPGQGHAAIDTASRLFVDVVLKFLEE